MINPSPADRLAAVSPLITIATVILVSRSAALSEEVKPSEAQNRLPGFQGNNYSGRKGIASAVLSMTRIPAFDAWSDNLDPISSRLLREAEARRDVWNYGEWAT